MCAERRPLRQLIPADPGVLVALVAADILLTLGIAHDEGGAVRPLPLAALVALASSGAGKHLACAADELQQFRIGAPEEDTLPGLAVGRHVLQVVAEQVVGFAAAAGAAVEQIGAPSGANRALLRAQLWRPN